jgi:thiol-disulfide isomerase/thioredoxin
MRYLAAGLFSLCLVLCLLGQDSTKGPTDKKAQKTYQQAFDNLGNAGVALWYFRKADEQDGGKCLPCQEQMVRIGLSKPDWKAVEDGASEIAAQAQDPKQQAIAHHYLGIAFMNEGFDQHQDNLLARAHAEFSKTIALYPRFGETVFDDGKVLAGLRRDDEAKAQFEKFVAMTKEEGLLRRRALQFIQKPELARANLAPEFGLVTVDGQHVRLDGLLGKVVLIHFWATSCDVCLRGLPHLRDIAKKFQNQPFVILSVSVDHDPAVWRSFLEKNEVPGLQYQDGFNGPMWRAFGQRVDFESSTDNVVAGVWMSSRGLKQPVPKAFTIDADGVLQAEKLSDSSLDDRLQQLISRAGTRQTSQ